MSAFPGATASAVLEESPAYTDPCQPRQAPNLRVTQA